MRLTPNLAVLLLALPGLAQSDSGELHLKVRDPHGAGVMTVVELVCEANDFHDNLETDDSGTLVAKRLRFGCTEPGFNRRDSPPPRLKSKSAQLFLFSIPLC